MRLSSSNILHPTSTLFTSNIQHPTSNLSSSYLQHPTSYIYPLISVIITTKNEEANIGRCLESIKKQTYPKDKIEIIVVDNNSTDKTKKIIRSFQHPTSHLQLQASNIKLFNHGPERSAQRNYGIKKAKGEYILFLDADMSLSRNVVRDCVRKFTGLRVNELVGLYIQEIILGDSYWCKVRNFERSFYNATVIDCVRFFPKKVWEEVGGFDESLTGPEDWDFDKRVRMEGKADRINVPLYHNERNFNLKEYLKGKSYYVESFERYIKKWGENDGDIKKQFGAGYRLFGVFMENGKWKKMMGNPVLALGMYLIRFYVGYIFIKNKLKL